jgi:hypothetical protein
MAELLKDVYNHVFIDSVAIHFQNVYPGFEKQLFITTIFDAQWASRELKSRLTFITQTLHHLLPSDFKKSTSILKKVAPFLVVMKRCFSPHLLNITV